MPSPSITALPTAPNRQNPATFATDADAFVAALPSFGTQLQAVADYVASSVSLSLSASSPTTHTIGTGSKNFTVQTGLSLVAGQWLVIADAAAPTSNYMIGQVSSYTSGTGALVVTVVESAGSGTKTDWLLGLTGSAGIGIAGLPPGYIDGLECSHAADTDHDITVATGSCRDDSDTYDCVLASALTKQLDAAWAAGTNAGGLVSGTVAINTLYLFGLLRNDTTGAIDAGWNTTATAPSGWSWMRTLNYYKTDDSSNIIGVVDVFRGNVVERQWKAVQVVSTGLTSTPYVFQSLGAFVPPTILQPEAVICGYGSVAGGLSLSVDSSNDSVVISQGTTNPASPPDFVFLPLIFQSGNWGIYYKGVGTTYTMTLSKVRFKR